MASKILSKTTLHLIERAPGVVDIEVEHRLKGIMENSKSETKALAIYMVGAAQNPSFLAGHVPKVGSVDLVFLVDGQRIVRSLGRSA